MITYTEEKIFTKKQAEELFLSVNWLSGRYPDRLFRALLASETVITAWDGDELVGLCRVLDDTAMMAYINYVLVRPSHQGKGIASRMLSIVKDKYKDFLYIEAMLEDKANVPFYEKNGFSPMENGKGMLIRNTDIK
ncbi:MAG: GNAT family N-acetyltransferase [Bullifex sp.]